MQHGGSSGFWFCAHTAIVCILAQAVEACTQWRAVLGAKP